MQQNILQYVFQFHTTFSLFIQLYFFANYESIMMRDETFGQMKINL